MYLSGLGGQLGAACLYMMAFKQMFSVDYIPYRRLVGRASQTLGVFLPDIFCTPQLVVLLLPVRHASRSTLDHPIRDFPRSAFASVPCTYSTGQLCWSIHFGFRHLTASDRIRPSALSRDISLSRRVTSMHITWRLSLTI